MLHRMPLEGWIKVWMYSLLGFLVLLAGQAGGARPRFDTSTDMGLVLVPADAEVESVIFRLRATDQDADFPLIFDITATVTPVVRIENLPCTLYNKICQANVILTRRLIPGRLHDFAVRVRDSKGDSNSMQATISVTNATTQRDKIFPHIPAIIMVPEDTKPGKELDYILVRSNQWSGKPVYIELWQPKELFTIRQRQIPSETRGVITLIGELDFETQSMYTLTLYATDPYTEPKKDTRNIAGLHLVVVVQDVQDVPPIFTLAPPLTKINNTVQPGDVVLRVHAEDGDKGVPREVTYGLVSEGNPFTPFFNISEATGEIILARPLEELTQITHVGAPVVLSVVAEEIRRSTMEPPAQATVVEVGLLLGEPGNSPPFFENDNYVAWMDENAEPGSVITFTEHYSTKVRDEDIGKAGVFALKLDNNNGTFEISPTVAERKANFIITVRDNSLIDYEIHKSLRFKIIAQEVGPATNLSATVPATIFLRDVNDNAPEFEAPTYEVTLSENVTAGTRVVQVRATDKDTGSFGRIQYTRIMGPRSEAFAIDPDTGIITVAMGTWSLDRETTPSLQLSVEARDEDGKGLRGIVPLIVNLLDVNDNAPIFQAETYRFTLNEDMTNFTTPAMIKALDADAEPPNNEIRYELIHGNYENKFYLDEITGELFLRESINKVRRTRHNPYQNFAAKLRKGFAKVQRTFQSMTATSTVAPTVTGLPLNVSSANKTDNSTSGTEEDPPKIRKKREDDDVVFTLTARAYDLGVPHMSGVTQVSVLRGPVAGTRNVIFVVPGENPDPAKTAETLAAITGGRITVQEIRPYTIRDVPNGTNVPSLEGGKKSIVVARVEPNGGGTSLVDIERIRAALAANGVGVIGGDMSTGMEMGTTNHNSNTNTNTNTNITTVSNEEVTIYKAENRLLFWLLIILGLLMLVALIALIICCICPGCPFFMEPRKRRVHSSETLIARSDGRPKRHLHRKHARLLEATWQGKKQAWSADPMRRNWQFNRRNRRAPGLASLPGDVHASDREHEILEKAASLRLRDGPVPIYLADPMRRPDEERIYIEDVEGLRAQGYGVVDMESLRHHDMERGSEMARQVYVGEGEERVNEQSKFVREQRFYRDGNAEILRLVTRGQMEEGMIARAVHRPQTLVIDQGQSGGYRVDGKDILLQRFIEDQKIGHGSGGQDLHDSLQDVERRSMESHQRQKEAINLQQQQQQQKILLIPERLEEDHRQHIEELGPDVQRLIIDHGSFEKTETKDGQELIPGATLLVHAPMPKVLEDKAKEQTSRQNVNVQHYSIHDLELARQNALLTRLLLERDGREVGVGAMADSASYLETQSLPGQVAIATQTDRTTATQTELPNRSRSDNDESEEEARMRKKLKSKKRYADGEPRRIRTLWMKSPIKEENLQYSSEKMTNIIRRKMKDTKDSRRVPLEPDVLREISDSLDENGYPAIAAWRKDDLDDSNSRGESRNKDGNERFEDSSSMELAMRDRGRIVPDKREDKSKADEEVKKMSHRGQRENVVEPSFRILEKEMSSLSKKLSKLAGTKILPSSNESETDSQKKTKTVVTDSKKIDKKPEPQVAETRKHTKVVEATKAKRSKSNPRTAVSESVSTKEQVRIREEIVVENKRRQLSKYRKSQTISTGSSDFEDASEKPNKQHSQIAHLEKQKQMATKSSHIKLKRQSKVEHKEPTKAGQLALPQETPEEKDNSGSASKGSTKSGKSERESLRIKKYSSGTGEGKPESGTLSSPSSDNSEDSKLKRKEGLMINTTKKSTAKTSEASGKASQEEMASVAATVIEIERESAEVPNMGLKILPETVATRKSESLHMSVDKKVTDETKAPATAPPKSSEGAEQRKSFPSITEEVFTMPKEASNDIVQAVQAQQHSITEGAGMIEDIIVDSVAVGNEDTGRGGVTREEVPDSIKLEDKRSTDDLLEPSELKDKESIGVVGKEELSELIQLRDEGGPSILKKEEVSEPVKVEDKGIIGFVLKEEIPELVKEVPECEDESMNTPTGTDQKVEKREVAPHKSEDTAIFSDNFDSFCGTDIHPKGSLDTQGSGDEFTYESLQSESSEEQMTAKKITDIKDAGEKDDVVKAIEKSKEVSLNSEIETKEDIEEPRMSSLKTPTLPQNDDESSERSLKKTISRTPTPIPHESEQKTNGIEEAKIEVRTDDAIMSDVPKHAAEFTKFPKIDEIHLESVESHIVKVPIVPPLDIAITDESNVTSLREQSETKSEILVASPRLLSNPEDIMLETGSRKEFGIADSLFVAAKLLKMPSRSTREIASDAKEEEPQKEKLVDGHQKIGIDAPPINLVELSRAMFEDADDSDSSEASSKTMLTARPYGTPRHRPVSGTDVKELETSEDKSINQPVETTENLRTSEPIKSGTKMGEKSLPEETAQEPREKSPEIQMETKPGISGRVIDGTVTLMEDVGKVFPDMISSEAQVEGVEIRTEVGSGMSMQISEEDSKKLEVTTAQEEDAKTAGASEQVQQLYQIRQEKLPADADGFDSLPETVKPVKSLDDTNLPEEVWTLPMEIAKTGVKAPVAKVPGAETKKAVPSTAKYTKSVVRKRESSKGEEIRGGARKLLTTSLKTLSPKKERKIKTVKDEASKIGKQSVVVEQFERSRDSKRQVRPAELQADEEADALSRTSQVRRTWRKVDRPEKDLQQREKVKPEKTKKAVSKSERGRSTNKRPSETRPTQERLKGSGMKKVLEKVGKAEESKKSVVESKAEKASKVIQAPHLDQQEIVKESGDPKEKEVQERMNLSKEEEMGLLSTVETEKSVIPSPISRKEDKGDKTGVDEPTFPEGSKGLPGETKSQLASSVSSNVKKESPPVMEETTITKETITTKEQTMTKETRIKFTEERTIPKRATMPEDKTVMGDPTMLEETTKSTAPSESPETNDSPTAIEASHQTDIPAKTLDVTKFPGEVMKVPIEIMKGAIGTEMFNLQPEVGPVQPPTGKETNEVADKIESSRKASELVAVSANQAEQLKSADHKLEEKGKLVTRHRRETEMVVIESQSRYMEWYKLKREEMERKRQERKEGEEGEVRPKWLRKSTRQRWFKAGPDDKRIFDPKIGEGTPRKKIIKPLVNVESEQLKAIVRQGRALRKAQGEQQDEPQIEIFAPEKPAKPLSSVSVNSQYHHHHHLVQHSAYKYEKMPVTPFYLHPPPAPHPSPQHYEGPCPEQYQSLPSDSRCPNEGFDSGIVVQQQQGGNKLRHQQLLEKKSVFDIAYSEAAPSQLRADSTTPPS